MPTAPQEVLIFPSPSLRLRGALGTTTPNPQNSTFANPMKKSGCKRAVFFPTHPCVFVTFEL
jgi:hypothetical protein